MKIFTFDPVTGKRGECIGIFPVATYADCGAAYAIENGKYAPFPLPSLPNRPNEKWTIHVDAGRFDTSYLTDQWVCFCLGCFTVNPQDDGVWEWVVLPPKHLLQPAAI